MYILKSNASHLHLPAPKDSYIPTHQGENPKDKNIQQYSLLPQISFGEVWSRLSRLGSILRWPDQRRPCSSFSLLLFKCFNFFRTFNNLTNGESCETPKSCVFPITLLLWIIKTESCRSHRKFSYLYLTLTSRSHMCIGASKQGRRNISRGKGFIKNRTRDL